MMRKMFGYLLAIILGFIPGFFVVFNGVFTDSSGLIVERLMSFALVVISFGILGGVFAYFSPGYSWRWGIWLSLPVIFVLVLYTIKEAGILLLSLSYILLTILSASGAAFFVGKKRQ